MAAAPAVESAVGVKPASWWRRITCLYPWVIVAILVAAAAVLRFHDIGQKSVWVDEGVSIEMARLDWYNFLRILWRHEANMALYTLLLRFWLPFGDSEAWIRSLSALAGLATISALFVLGRKLFDTRTGLIASFLLTVNAFHVRYSQEARSYALYPLLCVLSCIYFLKFLEEPTPGNRKGHVITSVLAVYTHFFAGFIVVAQWLSLKLLDRKESGALMKKSWKQFAIAILPLLLFVATTGLGVLRWIPRPGWSFLHVTSLLLTGNGGDRLLWLYVAACALALLFTLPAWLKGRRLAWQQWRYYFLAIWLVFPILAVFALSQWKPCLVPRYFIFTLPALALLAAAGLARLRWRVLIGAALVLFAAWSLPAVYSYYQKDFDIGREDFRDATHFILSQTQPGDGVLFHQPIGRMPYEYYRSITPAAAYPAVIYPAYGEDLTFRDFYSKHVPDELVEHLPTQYRRVWVVFTYNQLPSGPDPTTRLIDATFPPREELVARQVFPGVEVRLYRQSGGK